MASPDETISPERESCEIVPKELKNAPATTATTAIPILKISSPLYNNPPKSAPFPDIIIPITNEPMGGFGGMYGLQKMLDLYRGIRQLYSDYQHFKNLQSIQFHLASKTTFPVFTTPQEFLKEIRQSYWGSFCVGSFIDEVNAVTTGNLPAELREHFSALNCELGELNFYNAFTLVYVGDMSFAVSFRNAVAYDVLTNQEIFQDTCDLFDEVPGDVIKNLQKGGVPTTTEILLLSKMTDRNITVFELNENLELQKDVYFDAHPNRDAGSETIYLGKCTTSEGVTYFPLVRNSTACDLLPQAGTSCLSEAVSKRQCDPNSPQSQEAQPNTDLLPLFEKEETLVMKDMQPFFYKSYVIYSKSIWFILVKVTLNNESLETGGNKSVQIQSFGAQFNKETHLVPSEYEEDGYEMTHFLPKTGSLEETFKVKFNGLPNVGNSCYIAAAIQSLFALPHVRDHANTGPLKLLEEAIFTENIDANLQQLLTTTGCWALLEKINQIQDEDGNTHESFQEFAQDDSFALLQQSLHVEEYSPIQDMFTFNTKDKLACVVCDEGRELSPKQNLEIILPPSPCINTALREYFGFQESVNCNCEGCDSTIMTKSTILLDPPECLLVVTQSFDEVGNKQAALKNAEPYSEFVFLPTEAGDIWYELKSMVVHSGVSNTSGHFIANIKNDDVWVRADDDKVSVHKEPEIRSAETVYMQLFSKLSDL